MVSLRRGFYAGRTTRFMSSAIQRIAEGSNAGTGRGFGHAPVKGAGQSERLLMEQLKLQSSVPLVRRSVDGRSGVGCNRVLQEPRQAP
jgi:hypothetical protein